MENKVNQVPDGLYRYCKVNEDDSLKSQGVIKIDNGSVSIMDDPKHVLKNMFADEPNPGMVFDIMRSINRNGYAKFIKDDSSALIEEHEGNHDPAAISNEGKQSDFTNLSHLKAILEREEDAEPIDIPDHIVMRASSPHWEEND